MSLLKNPNNVKRSMAMPTRFDLEQEIMSCWNVVDDIKVLHDKVANSNYFEGQDDICNFLLGIETIYQAKFDKMFDTFEKCLKRGEFRDFE